MYDFQIQGISTLALTLIQIKHKPKLFSMLENMGSIRKSRKTTESDK